MMIFKIICLIIFSLCALTIFILPRLMNEKKHSNDQKRLRIIVRIRSGCFLAMLVLLLICIII